MVPIAIKTCVVRGAIFSIAGHGLVMADDAKQLDDPQKRTDEILELAIKYVQDGSYPPDLSKDRKRAVRKRATALSINKGEIFFKRGSKRVNVVASRDEQTRILKACHAEPTSGHFGVTKTYKRMAERFYWKAMIADVRQLVSYKTTI